MTTRIWIGAALVALAACGRSPEPRPTGEVVAGAVTQAVTQAVEPVEVPDVHFASGTLRATRQAVLTAKAIGTVSTLHAAPGEAVTAGQILIEIDAPELDAQVRRARAGRGQALQARAEASQAAAAADADARLAQLTLDRFARLFAERAVTRAELDQVEAAQLAAAAQAERMAATVRRADAALEQAAAELQAAAATADTTRITAPFAGRIAERWIDIGEMTAPGRRLIGIVGAGPLEATVSLPERLADAAQVGDTADVHIGDAVHRGRVTERTAIDPASRSFTIRLALDGPADDRLRPGMFARVGIATGTSSRLMVPATAIVRHGQLDFVRVVEGDRALLRMVTVGGRRDDAVEVLTGLTAGERLVVGGSDLDDGARVRVQ